MGFNRGLGCQSDRDQTDGRSRMELWRPKDSRPSTTIAARTNLVVCGEVRVRLGDTVIEAVDGSLLGPRESRKGLRRFRGGKVSCSCPGGVGGSRDAGSHEDFGAAQTLSSFDRERSRRSAADTRFVVHPLPRKTDLGGPQGLRSFQARIAARTAIPRDVATPYEMDRPAAPSRIRRNRGKAENCDEMTTRGIPRRAPKANDAYHEHRVRRSRDEGAAARVNRSRRSGQRVAIMARYE